MTDAAALLCSVKPAVLATSTKPASASGSFLGNSNLPFDATGTYTLTASGLTSGNVGTASITTVPTSAGDASLANTSGGAALGNTGATLPGRTIWIGTGAFVLSVAIIGTVTFVRRQHRTAESASEWLTSGTLRPSGSEARRVEASLS